MIQNYLPFLIPIIVLELILALSALIHLLRHQSFRFGNLFIWIIIVLFLQIIGPILYFTIGRGEDA
ncbi:PLDc N-terminal domain-containing protein [Sporolactobacillus shoreicorticis]|uniref:PLDc N-terminal domain-containing protein n=1 Tax=Sporolactobacillus shoreicorticis TaxID=1923877 RepID=A0ABW5S0H9_9BACL|nr:PLDc N-terminal domain-containing protein [Sporolactobacillus shoreicorticis]MCO7127234.1 PLDc N-terminal domain-containing protein [Sporolactobacillus shoreicorticis]